MKSGIYKITNKVNNNIYIGSACNFNSRWSLHIRQLSAGKHGNRHLQKSWDLYGRECFDFSIIEYCEKQDLLIREQYYIDTLNPQYNISRVAGSSLGIKRTQETKDKLSAFFTGFKHTQETKIKIGLGALGNQYAKGKKLSIETRKKMSLAKKGVPRTEETKRRISKAKKGKPISENTRLAISLSNKTRVTTDETRKKRSESLKKSWIKRKFTKSE